MLGRLMILPDDQSTDARSLAPRRSVFLFGPGRQTLEDLALEVVCGRA